MRVRFEQDTLYRVRVWEINKEKPGEQQVLPLLPGPADAEKPTVDEDEDDIDEVTVSTFAAIPTRMRLFELFEAILSEVSKYGTPQERDLALANMDQRAARERDKKKKK
jgi:hypothetical protein